MPADDDLLSALPARQTVSGVAVLRRFDMYSTEEITAHPAAGVSLGEARALCERLAEKVGRELGVAGQYRLTWPRDR